MMRTISVAVSDEIHQKLRLLKRHYDVSNIDSVIEKIVLKVLEDIEKEATPSEVTK